MNASSLSDVFSRGLHIGDRRENAGAELKLLSGQSLRRDNNRTVVCGF